jgi:hypothetical protein
VTENADQDLYTCWPDVPLCRLFRRARTRYEEMVRAEFRKRRTPLVASQNAFSNICGWVASDENVRELRHLYGSSWLQAVASILGMLMHFSVEDTEPALRNERRPGSEFSTYPTSPAIAKLAGEYVLGQVLREPVPRRILGNGEAERYVKRALRFRVLDPSMESGQMLLAFAMALLARTDEVSASVENLRRLRKALLKRLCRECLWGIDRNRLAPIGVSLVFSALGRQYGFELEPPRHLITEDALRWRAAKPQEFEGIINNPPWGERMDAAERDWIRREFPLAGPRIDTYAAFTQLAVHSLVADGAYALVLPAQAVSSQSACKLRELLVSRSELGEILIAPRHAFAHATVRSCVLKGRLRKARPKSTCAVVVYPFRKALNHRGPEQTIVLPAEAMRSAKGESWWMLFHKNVDAPSTGRTLPLAAVAQVHLGCQVYAAGEGCPPQSPRIVKGRPYTSSRKVDGWMPAVQVRDVVAFHVARPSSFVRFGKWLARPGQHGRLVNRERVLVRELCSREGRLKAAVSTMRAIPLHGVFSLVPAGIDAHVLAAILNSSCLAEYVKTRAASFTKVDFQRITTAELRQLPIPIAALTAAQQNSLGVHERDTDAIRRLGRLARQAHRLEGRANPARETLIEEIDFLVRTMYAPHEPGD